MHKIDIGQRLADLRKYARISRQSLAEISNIPAATIRAWEDGKTEIRPHNLEKYLKELNKIGCSATVEWVMNGGTTTPDIQITPSVKSAPSSDKLGVVDVITMIDILSDTSNLFYYLDSEERIIYINQDLLLLLGKAPNIHQTILENVPFKDVCSEKIYNTCHEHFKFCKKGKKQRFSYDLGNPYSKNPHTVEMFCCPVIKSRNSGVLGILGFISNHKMEPINQV